MAELHVLLHMDVDTTDPRRITWWADSPDVDGWTAGADTLDQLTSQVEEGLRFYLDSEEISVSYLMAIEVPEPQWPEVILTPPSEQEQIPPSRGVKVSQLVSA